MSGLFEQGDSATPLTGEEKGDLILSYISLRPELNQAEQENNLDARIWAFRCKRDVLKERFLEDLHRRMFGRVWRWAGHIRNSERNIGVLPHHIRPDLRQLLTDCRFWIDNKTFPVDEIAVRFHHRLVFIHPFPNGNGRHARLATDLLLAKLGREGFTWGRTNLVEPGETRRRYIAALRAADEHDYTLLLAFARD